MIIVKIFRKLILILKRIIKFFVKRIPRVIAKPLFLLIINLDDILLKARIYFFSLFCGKKHRVSKALYDLKTYGVAIIPNFYSEKEVTDIKNNCIRQLDSLPLEKLKTEEYIPNMKVNIDNQEVYLERLGGSLKLKGINNFFKDVGKRIEMKLINLIYHLSFKGPFLIYNLTHDGSFKHPAVPMPKINDEAIAGKAHVDLYRHHLRCFIALDDVKNDNGPTVYYKNSMNIKEIKENHLNLFLKDFDFNLDEGGDHYLNETKKNFLEEKNLKSKLICKKGDLALIDLKTAHYGTLPQKGQRHLLWLYY
tara:strand:+ start:40 stop:960 length:921 start_codon:yes stop_codon:yes gene_type:complete